ncbi:MAG: Gfo/Idh/MocA family oxidoreductase [Acidobacteria bacterium]|jgi:predicted dehydrogenase|nr:Gfo/Idh/MocA family oxidoreductase [Acidobacteriota bacterium]
MKPGINRRQFMQKSLVGAAAAPVIARSVGAEPGPAPKPVAPNDRIQVGVIGVGARAHQLLGATMAQDGVEIVGVCDAYTGRVARSIERTGGRAKDYGDWRALLDDESIDAVIIATPDHWHKEHALAALAAGKDVYLEKPMTLTIDEGPEFIAATDKTDRILQIGSNGMSSKLQQTAREIVKSGKLGKITLIRASYDRNTDSGAWLYPIPPDADEKTVDWKAFLGPAPERPFSLERFFRWRCFWDYSGGMATDLFVHLMTTIHYVMDVDMADMVMATGQNYLHQETHEVPDTLNAALTYPKEGFTVSLSGTFNNAEGSQGGFTIMGTEGALVFQGRELTFKPENPVEGNGWIVASWPSALEEAYWADPEVQKRETPGTWDSRMNTEGETWSEVGPDSTVLHMGHFIESVRTRKPSVQDARRGHHAAAVPHMVNESIKRQAPVYWDPQREVLKT